MSLEPITHDELKDLIYSGDPITGKVVAFPINFANRPFKHPLVFQNCTFNALVDFAGARFKWPIRFTGCVFEMGLQMSSAVVGGDCEFRGVTFRERAVFTRARIQGKLEMRAPKDKRELDGAPTGVNPYVTFDCPAEFSQIHVEGEINFGSAQFHRWADFYNVHIDGSAFFRIDRSKTLGKNLGYADGSFPPVRFLHGARFRDASISGELNFHGAQFWGTLDLSYISVGGDVFFKDPEKTQTDVGCRCFFSNQALWIKNATLEEQIQFVQPSGPTHLALQKPESGPDDVLALSQSFYATISAVPKFALLKFTRKDGQEVSFWSQELLPEATLASARLKGSLYFDNAHFEIPLELKNCKIAYTLEFKGDHGVPKRIDLSDCEYKHITIDMAGPKNPSARWFMRLWSRLCPKKSTEEDTAAIKVIMNAMEEQAKASRHYRRQPWVQLESVLRRMGEVDSADAVYLRRRRLENERLSLGAKQLDKLWDWSSLYGIAPRRLLIIGLSVVLLGTILFGLGQVASESEHNRRVIRAAIEGVTVADIAITEDTSNCFTGPNTPACLIRAADASLYQFSPVKLPIGEDYRPEGWLAIWAALERVIGWIIVPLVVGTLAGQLDRKAKAKEGSEGADE